MASIQDPVASRDFTITQLTKELATANKRIAELKREVHDTTHEGCGGRLVPTHLICEACNSRHIASPRGRRRKEVKDRQTLIIQLVAQPFYGPAPTFNYVNSTDIRECLGLLADEHPVSRVHSALVNLPRQGLLIKLGLEKGRQQWGVTAKGAKYAGLSNLIVFKSPPEWHWYEPSPETVQLNRLNEGGCSNE